MISATVLTVLIVPVFYVIIEKLSTRKNKKDAKMQKEIANLSTNNYQENEKVGCSGNSCTD